MPRMLRFIGRFFKKPAPPPLPGSSPEELWRADFTSPELSRFQAVDEERYSVHLDSGALVLDLHRDNLFAWADAGDFRYTDVSIEAEISFGEAGSRRSAGLLFRKLDDSSFMYVLVSSDGEVRLDVVFNGDPRTIVPWIACPWASGAETMVLSVVSRGPRIVVLVNGRFALEAEDDSLDSGGIAFAAQSYSGLATFRLDSLRIDSRPMEAESDYLRFARIVAADSDQRRRLAEGFFGLGHNVPALVQLRKVADRGEGTARDKFLEAESLLRMDLKDEAAEAIEACLLLDPDFGEAIEERYNLLYLRGNYSQLREHLEADSERLSSSPRLLNLLGHAYYNLGSWKSSAEAYARAAAGDPGMPIYARNHAMALENAGDHVAASAAWLAAAKGFYTQEAWEDATDCSMRLRKLGYDKAVLDSLDGLVAYGRGDLKTAETLLSKLVKKGRADASSTYIHGLIMASAGKRTEALRDYRKAVELEPELPIYRYRLAEALFVAGERCDDEIAAALAAAPADGWTLNLAGQAALSRGQASEAADFFRKAAAALPGEAVPVVNLSQALSARGDQEQALETLGTWPARNAAAANRLGNVYAATGKLETAANEYRNACALGCSPGTQDPELPEYRVNLAAALFELGELADAEDSLRRALETRDDPRALKLMGDIAAEYGDFSRAEMAYRAALERAPGDTSTLSRLAGLYMARHRYKRAAEIADELEILDPGSAASLKESIHAATSETLACASCKRSWEVPRPAPAVPRARLRGEPSDDTPAGSCPACGKVYCVACRKDALADGHFTCPECGGNLNLNDDRVRWIVLEKLKISD